MSAENDFYLYHYTTAEGLKGIVGKQEIWASSVFSLNDSQEFWHGRAFIKKCVKKRCQDVEARVFQRVMGLIDSIGLQMPPHIYVCCFTSGNGAADNLNQWRGYCPQGGFSIGFPKVHVERLAAQQQYFLVPCQYEEQKKKDCANGIAEDIHEALPHIQEPLFDSNIIHLTTQLAGVFKDKAFEDEQEWRLLSYANTPTDGIAFRTRNGLIIPYLKFSLRDEELWQNARVRIGPCLCKAESLEYVKMLFSSELPKSNLPVPPCDHFENSTVPYRYL